VRHPYWVDANGCWRWRGYVHPKYGYGYSGDKKRAHRLYYEHFIGLTKGLQVQHICDVRDCVNPSHLKLGTQADNMRDCVERQRISRGEVRHNAIFTEKRVRELLSLKGCMKNKDAAKLFGTSRSVVSLIWSGKRWKHLQ